MDDRRFDTLVKSLAAGTSRRNVLKGLFGLGGVAVVGGALLEHDVEAARRPTPTPKPPSCPGMQVPCATGCCCPPGLHNCGPACCTEDSVPAPLPGHTECCDNACCQGTCYGEEFCCPTNQTTGGGPPAYYLCEGSNGQACCAEGAACCEGLCFDAESLLCCGGSVYPLSYVCCDDVAEIGDCCVDGDCNAEANCCNNECCDALCCGVDCCGNGWLCCNDQCYDPATSACCDGTITPGVCCPGGEGCEAGQNCCVEGETTYCTSAPCECDRMCSDAGLDCCTINNVFAGCYDASASGACCTAGSCEHLNEFDDCLVGACIDFACEQRSSCASGQYCCSGSCGDTPCTVADECILPSDCASLNCCDGLCCEEGQNCCDGACSDEPCGGGEGGDPCLDNSQCLSAICCEGRCCPEGERCLSGVCGNENDGGEPGDACRDHSQCLSAICCEGTCCAEAEQCGSEGCGSSSGDGEPGDPCRDHSQCLSAMCCEGSCCADGYRCCGGACTDLECETPTSCSDNFDCPGDAICCVGDCCSPGQSCVTDPNNNSYCA